MLPPTAHPPSPESALTQQQSVGVRVARWARLFESQPEFAQYQRQELSANGSLPDAPFMQLGLSVALTPEEYRCSHFGDTRICPQCLHESLISAQQRPADPAPVDRPTDADDDGD